MDDYEQLEPEPDPLTGAADVPSAPDQEWEEYVAWRERETAAGQVEEAPAPWEIEGPALSLSLGDATDIDPGLLAAIVGPDGLGGGGLGPQFSQDAAADVLRPGPVLASLTEQAIDDLSRLTDNELIGTLHAARRLENRAYCLQTQTIAEFARRRAAELEAAQARGVPVGCREGEFPGAELAAELLVSKIAAAQRIDAATSLATRLPRTLQGMSAGLIDGERAEAIAAHTACLNAADAAAADEILAAAAPGVRAQTLARRAAALAMKLNPEAVKRHKERTRRVAQRVEARCEQSGNASVAGRELDTADALASMANIRAIALRLRRGGLEGSLDRLRTMVFNDLLQGRNSLDRLAPVPEVPAEDASEPPDGNQAPAVGPVPPDVPVPEDPVDDHRYADDPHEHGYEDPADEHDYDDAGTTAPDATSACTSARAPMPAVINLLVYAGTLFGYDTTPAQVDGWGLLDPGETRAVVRAASLHPQTRWSLTVVGSDGTAIAHGRSAGQHPWTPKEKPKNPEGKPEPRSNGPTPEQAARFAELLRALNITLEPIARGTGGHGHAEDRYRPSRRLQDLVRARNATCTAPGCQAQAIHADLDHTIPYPEGPTDENNLGPTCRSDHRAKQAPGWKVEQPEPGVFRWTLPSGRIHITRPTVY